MSRGSLIAFVVLVAVGLVLAGIMLRQPPAPETPPPSQEAVANPVEAVPPPPEPAGTPEAPTPVVVTPPEQNNAEALEALTEALKEAARKEQEEPTEAERFEGVQITDESLAGVKYKQGVLEFQFAPGHKCLINGRERAKWEIVGSKVRLYDDKGEEHWLDIDGDKLLFEGQPLELWK